MNDKNLKQLFDFQKFDKNSALELAIQSAHAFAEKQSKLNSQPKVIELFDEDLDMLSAAGIQHPVAPVKK